MFLRCVVWFGVLAASTVWAASVNWPGWRGPKGDGSSEAVNVPTVWSGSNNIAWKSAVPGQGHSSPVVWEDRIFLTTALRESKERCLLCFDRLSGRLLWQVVVVVSPLEGKNSENSFASSTPATDGERVYVTFLDGKDVVVAAYDFSGKQVWLARPGQFYSQHGFSHNPTLFEGLVVLVCDSKGENFIGAISREDGRTVWKVQRDRASQSYSPPLIREMAGRMQMVVPGNEAVTSLDPRSGRLLWQVNGQSSDAVVCPVYNESAGLVLSSSSWPKRVLVAIRPDGDGEANRVAWSSSEGAPYVPSPISAGDCFYTLGFDSKEAFCFEASTGKVLWREKVGTHHASPVLAEGRIYFLNDDGVAHVVRAGRSFELVSRNELGERTYASPAVRDGQIYIRTFGSLYAIGGKAEPLMDANGR